MAMIGNKQVLFKDYVKGFPKEENMILTESAIGSKVPEGSTAILVKNLYISCDPYMRLMMSDPKEGGGHPFLGSFILGQVDALFLHMRCSLFINTMIFYLLHSKSLNPGVSKLYAC